VFTYEEESHYHRAMSLFSHRTIWQTLWFIDLHPEENDVKALGFKHKEADNQTVRPNANEPMTS